MGRIKRGFENKFRSLLRSIQAGRIERRIERLLDRACRLSAEDGLSASQAFAQVSRDLQRHIHRWKRRYARQLQTNQAAPVPATPSEFLCDAGLGGLARWLRAAGYEARWVPEIEDDELIRQALGSGNALLTTDALLMERRVVLDGSVRAVWVPPALTIREQLQMVLDELDLPLLEPRCMECGGDLQKAEKEALRNRIPPRTYRWLDEYFTCSRCGKLFWHGTHWERIRKELQSLAQLKA